MSRQESRNRGSNRPSATPLIPQNEMDNLKCVICLEFLEGAVETSCGHAFCSKCMVSFLNTDTSNLCPTCRGLITFVHPSFALRKIVAGVNPSSKSKDTEIKAMDNKLAAIIKKKLGEEASMRSQRISPPSRSSGSRFPVIDVSEESKIFWKALTLVLIIFAAGWFISFFSGESRYIKDAPIPSKRPDNIHNQPSKTTPADYMKIEEFLLAASSGDNKKIEKFLADGVDVNSFGQKDGVTALWNAAKGGHLETVELLISKGAS